MTFFLHTLAILPGNKIHLSNQRPKPPNPNPTALRRLSPISVSLLAAWLGGTAKASVGSWTRWHSSSGREGREGWIFCGKNNIGRFQSDLGKDVGFEKRRGEVFWFWSGFCNDISRVHVSICSVLVLGLESKSFEVWKPFVWPMGLSYEAVDISHLVTVVSLSIFQSEYWQFLQILHLRHLNIIDIDCTGTSV